MLLADIVEYFLVNVVSVAPLQWVVTFVVSLLMILSASWHLCLCSPQYCCVCVCITLTRSYGRVILTRINGSCG